MTHDDAISLYTPIHARGESIIAKCVMWRHASCRQRFLFEAAYIVCFWRWSGHRGTNGRRALWAKIRHRLCKPHQLAAGHYWISTNKRLGVRSAWNGDLVRVSGSLAFPSYRVRDARITGQLILL